MGGARQNNGQPKGRGAPLTSLLFANDLPGQYPPSWYAATANETPARPALEGDHRTDVAILGAGYTGLSAALHLAQRGTRVILLEAQKVGWGASGRNGGQLGIGQRVDQPEIEATYGMDTARALWEIGKDANALAKSLIKAHAIDCDLRPGIAYVNHRPRFDSESRDWVDHMARIYAHETEYLPPEACRALVKSPAYSAGILDLNADHLHPLNYALGLAKAAEAAGASIHERSEVTAIKGTTLNTAKGSVTADQIILAGNGYIEGLAPQTHARVMPINNFIIATEPLDPATILTRDIAVADSKFVVNYFRMSRDNRLLFGGRESYGYRFPKDIKSFVRKAMLQIFPQLSDAKIDYGWGGTLAITRSRLPHLRRDGPIWSSSGYSGHGVALATMCGKLTADAILKDSKGFDIMATLPHQRFPGGPTLRHPLLIAAMLWYTLRDRL